MSRECGGDVVVVVSKLRNADAPDTSPSEGRTPSKGSKPAQVPRSFWTQRFLCMDSFSGTVSALDDSSFRDAVKHALRSGLGCKPTIVVDVISDPN